MVEPVEQLRAVIFELKADAGRLSGQIEGLVRELVAVSAKMEQHLSDCVKINAARDSRLLETDFPRVAGDHRGVYGSKTGPKRSAPALNAFRFSFDFSVLYGAAGWD